MVELQRSRCDYALLIIEAESEDEVEAKALEMAREDRVEWRLGDDAEAVVSINPLNSIGD